MSRRSLFDSFLLYLAGSGYDIPAEQLNRDLTKPWEASADVQRVLVQVYGDDAGPSGDGRQSLRDMADGQQVATVFCVRERELRQKKNGEDFLKLMLSDRTGTVEAVAWEEVGECCAFRVTRWLRGRFTG